MLCKWKRILKGKQRMRVGEHVVYNGKDYRGSIKDDNKVSIISHDPEDEKNGFTFLRLFNCYEKIVDIEEVSEVFKVIEMCDYMGETFIPLGGDDEVVGLFVSDSKYLEMGFVQDGRDGYMKEIKRSEAIIRQVKENLLLYYRIKRALRERITDDQIINDFSFGVLNRRTGHGMKGCFFYDGRYYVYRKTDGHDVVGPLNERGLYLLSEEMDIIGPFNDQDLLYACVKILGKEELFRECTFSKEAKKTYTNNIYHSKDEMKEAAYLIDHK